MKKNKKQLKREKKNLRRLNEMKRIQKLTEMSIKNYKEEQILFLKKNATENIAVTDFGIDQYGNATHRFNEKGVVDSSVKEMFGCEIEKSIPAFVRIFSDEKGLGEFIRVPIRKNGLTGSGKELMCHLNVGSLVDWKGGTTIGGYHVIFYKDTKSCTFHYHSIWVNSDGNASCVTNNYDPEKNHMMSRFTEETITTKGNKEYILFIPVFVGNSNSIGWTLKDVTILRDWKYKGFALTDIRNRSSWTPISVDQIGKSSLLTNGHGNVKFERWDDEDKKKQRLSYLNRGGFSNPSLATGKSWNVIKSELRAVA